MPMEFMKLAHMKNGSMAGKILFAHMAIPFCAESNAVSGNITIKKHAAPAADTAIIYLNLRLTAFKAKKIISMINIMKLP